MPKSNKPGRITVADKDTAVDAPMALAGVAADAIERRIALAIIVVATILSTIPFAAGMFRSFPDYQYVGQVYNIDDYMVYSSWTRQVADGHFFLRNLFTNDPQLGRQINVYFLVLGGLVRYFHIPIAWAIEVARFIGGVALLWLIYRFYRMLLPGSVTGRLIALTFTSLGTGLGWLWARVWWDGNRLYLPVDTWQPEAFTFLSLTASALFVVSTLLIVATMYLLVKAERTGQARWAVCAGACGMLIGNIHSYDIIHVVGAWGLYLVVRDVAARRFRGASWGRAVIAGAMSIPTVAYQFYLFKHDPVFHARVDTATHSQSPVTYLLGYGVMLVLAAAGCVLALASRRFADMWRDKEEMLLPICWIVGAFALVYIPSSFQRKMIMGVDIPLGLLAGAALAYLTQVSCTANPIPDPASPMGLDALQTKRSLDGRLGRTVRGIAIGFALAASLPTGLLFVCRDLRHIAANTSETSAFPFLSKDELDVFAWVRTNTSPNDVLLGPPNLLLYVPGYCDRTVWCGHWGETSDYPAKYAAFAHFSKPDTSDDVRRAFLSATSATYLVALRDSPTFPSSALGSVPYLQPVYTNDGFVVYAIHPTAGLLASRWSEGVVSCSMTRRWHTSRPVHDSL